MTGNVPGDARVEGRKHRRDVSLRRIFVGFANSHRIRIAHCYLLQELAPPAELAPPPRRVLDRPRHRSRIGRRVQVLLADVWGGTTGKGGNSRDPDSYRLDDTFRAELRDLTARVAQLGENLVGVLAQCGRPAPEAPRSLG